mgnify:CR=1 FL=1|tara:strand:+ start:613 stop:1623 length:1011 start_codon:yes stop_codon:yes gene_type:complete
MKIFSGTSNVDFAERVCRHLNVQPSKVKISTFKDGEKRVIIEESVRLQDCFVIQPTCRSTNNSVNDSIVELLILIDALKRGSAKSVNVIIPYFGYQRQDRKDYSRAPISASVIARCLESQNINRVIVYDLHAGQISGFFSNNCPVDNLYVEQYFINYINKFILNEIDSDDLVIVSPDEGAVKTNIRVSTKLNCNAATIFKNRNKDSVIDQMNLMGDVNGKNVIMVDDIIDSGGTACKAAELLKSYGAKDIYFMASHGLLSSNALEKIENSPFKKVVITNTVLSNDDVKKSELIDIIDVSRLCSEAIRRVQDGNSLTLLYDSIDFQNDLYYDVNILS